MKFYKLQGAGNDFIIIDNRAEHIPLEKIPVLAKRLCARKLSLGADCLLLAGKPENSGDLSVKVFNADGSESEMCGNGMRCVARFAHETGLAKNDKIIIETVAGEVPAIRIEKRLYKIKLQSPSVLDICRAVTIGGKDYQYTYVELGNPGIPHAVLYEAPGDLSKLPELLDLARTMRHHHDFPKGANVNFWRRRQNNGKNDWVQPHPVLGLISPNEYTADHVTYERGVEDFTLACGTGAGSTAVSLKARGIIGNRVTFYTPGGILTVDLEENPAAGEDEIFPWDIWLSGDAVFVARGEIMDLEEL
jgi:diaminopimelate epimerase